MRFVGKFAACGTINLVKIDLKGFAEAALGVEIGHPLHVDATALATALATRTGEHHSAAAAGPAHHHWIGCKLLADVVAYIFLTAIEISVEEGAAAVERLGKAQPRVADGIVRATTRVPGAHDIARQDRVDGTAAFVILHRGDATVVARRRAPDNIGILFDRALGETSRRCDQRCDHQSRRKYRSLEHPESPRGLLFLVFLGVKSCSCVLSITAIENYPRLIMA